MTLFCNCGNTQIVLHFNAMYSLIQLCCLIEEKNLVTGEFELNFDLKARSYVFNFSTLEGDDHTPLALPPIVFILTIDASTNRC